MLLHGSSSLLVPSVLVIIVAAAYSLISVHTSAQGYGLTVPNTDLRLGEGGYDIESLMTPSLTGWQLQLFAWASTHSPSLVRLLLNTNGVHKLRALAQQVPPSTPPVLLPLVRLTTSERARHAALAVEPDSATLAAWRFSASDATDPTFWSVEDYAVAYRSGKADPPSVVARVYAAIDASRERLGRPFVETRRTEALAAAAASAERIAAGKAIGIFDGVPIAVKDEVDVARYKSAHGTVGDDYIFVATDDDLVVARFRAAGAIIVGKTSMTEWGTSPIGYNAHAPYQGPFNAYNTSYVSGGSSAGSAVAVAAGIVPLAVGFDGGGSIRIPAAVSGVFGLAGTYGRVPFGDAAGHSGPVSSMIKCGPLAATSRDMALAYLLMAQAPPPSHAYSAERMHGGDGPPPAHLAAFFSLKPFAGVRIGVFPAHFADADPEAVRVAQRAVDFMVQQGAVIVDLVIPHLSILTLAHSIGIASEFGKKSESTWHLGKAHHYGAPTAAALAIARAWSGLEVHAAQTVRGWAMEFMRTKIYASQSSGGLGIDLIASPTVGAATPKITPAMRTHGKSDTSLVVKFMKYIFMANLCGLPAVNVPVGYTESESLPMGLHLMASWWEESKLLAAARGFEEGFLPAVRRRPASWSDVLSPQKDS